MKRVVPRVPFPPPPAERWPGALRRVETALVAAALAACVELQPPAPVQQRPEPKPAVVPPAPAPPAPAPVPIADEEAREVSELLGYHQRVAQLGPDDQKRELATATQGFNRERSNASRIRLALLYGMPGTAFQDDARALQLLDPVVNAGGGPLRQFAGLLHAHVAERMKTQKRADQLKEQVDALRAIEKQLIDRGQPPPSRK